MSAPQAERRYSDTLWPLQPAVSRGLCRKGLARTPGMVTPRHSLAMGWRYLMMGGGGGAGSPSRVGGIYDNARAASVIGLTRPNCAPACSIDPSGSVALDDGVLVVRVVAPPGTAAGDSGRLAGSAGRWAG